MSLQEGVLLGGSWVVVSMVISPLIWVRTIVTLPIAPLISTHEHPSIGCVRDSSLRRMFFSRFKSFRSCVKAFRFRIKA